MITFSFIIEVNITFLSMVLVRLPYLSILTNVNTAFKGLVNQTVQDLLCNLGEVQFIAWRVVCSYRWTCGSINDNLHWFRPSSLEDDSYCKFLTSTTFKDFFKHTYLEKNLKYLQYLNFIFNSPKQSWHMKSFRYVYGKWDVVTTSSFENIHQNNFVLHQIQYRFKRV